MIDRVSLQLGDVLEGVKDKSIEQKYGYLQAAYCDLGDYYEAQLTTMTRERDAAVERLGEAEAWEAIVYLIGDAGNPIKYRSFNGTQWGWTDDPQKAIWFSRRSDAELISAEDEDAWVIDKLSLWNLKTLLKDMNLASRIPSGIASPTPPTEPGEMVCKECQGTGRINAWLHEGMDSDINYDQNEVTLFKVILTLAKEIQRLRDDVDTIVGLKK